MSGIRGGSRSTRIVSASQPYNKTDKPRNVVAPRSSDGNKNVYVSNLSWDVSWQDLKDHMKSAGHVLRSDVMLEAGGRSKGFGVVEYFSANEARAAIRSLHNTELKGRVISVREDVKTRPVDNIQSLQQKSDGMMPHVAQLGVSHSVYVGNLSYDVVWQDLKDHFKSVGNVIRANVMMEPSGRSKGCGIVDFDSIKDANEAIMKLHNTELKGRLIFVRENREAIKTGATQSSSHNTSHEHQPPKNAGRSVTVTGNDNGRNRLIGNHQQQAHPNGSKGEARLYVGNLAWNVKWYDLKDLFKQVCPVLRADVILENDGVRSRGFGIVVVDNAVNAAAVIEKLNGSILHERQIFVREDQKPDHHPHHQQQQHNSSNNHNNTTTTSRK